MDKESQYQWSKAKGFHARLIPAMILGAVISSFFLSTCAAAFWSNLGFRSWQSLLIMILVIGCPFGALLGYLVGLGYTRKRLRFLKWAEANGWSYEAKPKSIEIGGRSLVKHLQQSTIFWKHAKKRDLIHRQFGDQRVGFLMANGLSHGGSDYDSPSGRCVFVMIDNLAPCPPMNIHPRKFVDHFQFPLSRPQISFESEDFNAAWVVYATDAKAAYGRVSQKVMEFLLDSPSCYLIEFIDDLLIVEFWISEAEELMALQRPLRAYRKAMKFVEEFMAVVPNDLLQPIEVLAELPEFSDENNGV